MDIENQIDILRKERSLILSVVEKLSIDQINEIPKGHKNNIGWNLGHLAVTPYLILYGLSGLEIDIDKELVEKYRKGTSPEGNYISQNEWLKLTSIFENFTNKLESDYKDGLFIDYKEYLTSVNVVLDSFTKALIFNTFHEGIHLGIILSQKKLVL